MIYFLALLCLADVFGSDSAGNFDFLAALGLVGSASFLGFFSALG